MQENEEDSVPLLYYGQIFVVTILLLGIMLWYALGQGGKRQAQDSLFVALLLCALSMVVFDFSIDLLVGRVFPGSHILLKFSVFSLYMGNPILSGLYLLYLDQLRRRWIRIPYRIGAIAFAPSVIACLLCLLNLFNGMIFTIDTDNLYHRGPFFYCITLIAYGALTLSLAYLLWHRKSFRNMSFFLLLLFPFLLLIGSLLHLKFYGLKVAGISMVLALLVFYLHMQNSQVNRDHLTLLYNRSLSEQYLCHLIHHRNKAKALGGILMDINNFKQINDWYGHDLGDASLRHLSRLLVDSFKGSWVVARYGGDEFLLFRDGLVQQDLQKELAHFSEQLALFNASKVLPLPLSVSIGSALYGASDATDGHSFIKVLDTLMYRDKRRYHAQQTKSYSADKPIFEAFLHELS